MSQSCSLEEILQALLFASPSPIPIRLLSEIAQEEKKHIEKTLHSLQEQWRHTSVLSLVETGAGWQVAIRGEFAPYLQKLFEQKPHKLSKAVLETLALIAYRGPLTRSDIEQVRGVAVNPSTIRQLLDAGWVDIVGHKEVPGRPQLFATTKKFLSDFQLRSLKDLPEYQEMTVTDTSSSDSLQQEAS